MTATLLHNPRCSKSRQALQLLQEKGIEFAVRPYLDQPLTAEEMQALLKALGMQPRELLRKGEEIFKELKLADPQHTDEDLIQALVEHPRLMERPVLICGERAVVGRPPERVLELLA